MIVERVISEENNSPFDTLTNREFEVIIQMLRGNSTSDIANTLHLTKSTVGTHKHHILKKLKIVKEVEPFKLAQHYKIIQ